MRFRSVGGAVFIFRGCGIKRRKFSLKKISGGIEDNKSKLYFAKPYRLSGSSAQYVFAQRRKINGEPGLTE